MSTFEMDGVEHARGENCDCTPEKCSCGGWVHSQGGYGYFWRECDACGRPDGPSASVNPKLHKYVNPPMRF